MSGDERRDRSKSQVRSPSASSRGNVTSNTSGHAVHDAEFEAPTRRRGRTVTDSELSVESLASMSAPVFRPIQDSFHPVRVPARSVRPPMSFWARTWATFALVIVVAGGAVGIIASLRAQTLDSGSQSARGDARAAPSARTLRTSETSSQSVAPAAAPGFAAPVPVAPTAMANRSAAAPAASSEAISVASSTSAAREVSSAVAFRTLESLAREARPVSPASGATAPAASTLPMARRTSPADAALVVIEAPPEASGHVPAPDPATSDTPEDKGASEAWVTEERRF